MKISILKHGFVCGAMLALAFSCIDPADHNDPNVIDGLRYGRLSISSVDVIGELTEKNHGSSTRAVSADPFYLTIIHSDSQEEVHTNTVAGFETLDLPEGDYTVVIESHPHTAAEWSKVHYRVSRDFTITYNNTTPLNDLVCKVSSILVSVSYEDEMLAAMTGDYGVDVKIGNHTLSYEKNDGRWGNFIAEAEKNVLNWDFYGTVDGEYIEQSGFFKDVKAGEHRKLKFSAELVETGYATFELVVSADVETYDVNLEVEIEEPILPDPNDPGEDPEPTEGVTIEAEGFDLENGLTIIKAQAEAETPPTVKVNISAPEGIAQFLVDITSSHQVFLDGVTAMGLKNFDLAHPGELESLLKSLELIDDEGVLGKTSVPFDISGFVPMIAMFYDETEEDAFDTNFSLTVVDSKGESTTETIKLHFIR